MSITLQAPGVAQVNIPTKVFLGALSGLIARWKLPLWSIFIGLTALLLLYPVDLKLQPVLIRSPEVFPNLPLFGGLFYFWAALLLLHLFIPSAEVTARWERLALVAVAALVYRGFWTILSPLQLEAITRAEDTNLWQRVGHVTSGPGVYSDWPGASLASSVVSQVTGLELFNAIQILTLFVTLSIALATYVALLGLLGSSLFAAVGSVAILEGSVALNIYHQPGPTALAFFVLFLAVFYQREIARSPSRIILILLLLAATTVTHLHTSVHFFFVFLGVWLLRFVGRSRREQGLPFGLLGLALLIPLSWNIYWGTLGFPWITQWAATMLSDPTGILLRAANAFTIGQANFGESAPRWYSITRQFWLVALYAAGGLLWLWNLTKIHRLDGPERTLTASFFGVVLLSLLSCVVSPNGTRELLRLLAVGVFFTAPMFLLALQKLPQRVGPVALTGLAVCMVAVSLPTFLANYIRINTDVMYQSELAPGMLLQSIYDRGSDITLVGTGGTLRPILYYIPSANGLVERQDHELAGLTTDNWWLAMDDLIGQFLQSPRDNAPSFFVASPKEAVQRAFTFGIPADDPRWRQMQDTVAATNHAVYDNGVVHMFTIPLSGGVA